MKNPRGLSLTAKALIAIIIVLLPVVFSLVREYYKTRDHLKEHVLQDLRVTAEAFEGQIFLFTEMARRRAEDFSTDHFIRTRFKEVLAGAEDPETLNHYLTEYKLPISGHVESINLLTPRGRVVASSRPDHLGLDLSEEPFFRNSGLAPVSRTYHEGRKRPQIAVYSPVTDTESGETLGYLTNFFYLSELSRLLSGEFTMGLGALTSGFGSHETMEAYLVNREGFMVTDSRFVGNAVLSQRVSTPPVATCFENGREMAGFYPDYRGTEVAGASMCLPDLGWVLLVEVDASETLGQLHEIRTDLFITGAFVTALIASLLLLYLRVVARPLGRTAEAARKMASGDYDVSVPVESSDEVGRLGEAFNEMALEVKNRTEGIKANELKYRSLVARIPDVVWTSDAAGNTTFITPNVEGVIGFTAEEVMERGREVWFGRIHPDDAVRVKEAFSALFTEGRTFDVEYRIRRRDGSWLWLHDRALAAYTLGGRKYADGVFSNITERKEAETLAAESWAKLENLLRHAPIGIAITTPDGRVTRVNPAAWLMLGYSSEEELLNADISDHYADPGDRESFVGLLMEEKQVRNFEVELRKKDGSRIWASITSTCHVTAEGEEFINAIQDITEKRAYEQALRSSEKRLREAQHIACLGSWDWDIKSDTLNWTDEIYRIFGLRPREFNATYEAFVQRTHPDDREAVQKAVKRAVFEGGDYFIEHRVVRPNGETRFVQERGEVSFDDEGNPLRMVGTVQDITETRETERQIEMLAAFPAENPNPVLRVSDAGEVLYANDASRPLLEAFGCEPGEVLSDSWKGLVARAVETDESVDTEVTHDGRIYTVAFTPIEGADYVYLYGRDITEKKTAEFEIRKLSAAIEQSVNIVFITDRDGVIEYVNPMFEKITEYSKDEAVGQNPRILASGDTPRTLYEELWETVLAGKTFRYQLKNKTRTGDFYWCNTIISPIRDDRGDITHFLAVQEDITEKMRSREQIRYLERFDTLTELPNRTNFMEQVDEWVKSTASDAGLDESAEASTGSLFIIDIDQFKFVNDTFGHGTGDELLRSLTGVLSGALARVHDEAGFGEGSESPVLGRLSGDEFAVFLPSFAPGTAFDAAESLRLAVSAAAFPSPSPSVSVSIGLAHYPSHGSSVVDLLTMADAALFRAKDLGRNRCHVYRPEYRDLEKMHSRLNWKNKVLKALAEDRFVPWFQPILDLSDGRVHHYEALARMIDETGKILLPGTFIDVAERFGLVGEIDRVITEKAFRIQSALRSEGRDVSFAVNLSGKDLGDEEILEFIKKKLGEAGGLGRGIVFEITETAAIGDISRAVEFIRELKAMGCRFAIDDFGVGFTSFRYLKEMDADYVKIDGSFIRKLDENPKDRALVKAITTVADSLGIETIAEFVENEGTLRILKGLGVDYAQGYHIGKPAPDVLKEDGGEKNRKTAG